MAYALVVGESLVDVVLGGGEYAGGSAANVAVAASRLGREVRLLTALGEDAHGALISGHLRASRVEFAADPHVLGRTATATATIGPAGAASYSFDLAWRVPPLTLGEPPQAIHVCSLGAVLEPGATAVRALLESRPGGWVSYDLNARPAVTGTGPEVVAAVERIAALAGLVKASDEDLATLWPGLRTEAAAAHLRSLGPAAVVVTRGGDGFDWLGERTVHVDSVPTTVVDTIGAGDTVSGALLDALWDTGPRGLAPDRIERALAHAARAAAITVGRPGADPPWSAEL